MHLGRKQKQNKKQAVRRKDRCEKGFEFKDFFGKKGQKKDNFFRKIILRGKFLY